MSHPQRDLDAVHRRDPAPSSSAHSPDNRRSLPYSQNGNGFSSGRLGSAEHHDISVTTTNAPICGVMRYHPSHERELLARTRCGNRKLGEMQTGFPRQSVRVEQLTGRISDHRRIEARIASAACGRRARTAVAGADDPEAGKSPGVVRIHQQHEREQQRTHTEERAAEHDEPAPPCRPRVVGRMTAPIRT